MPLISAAYEIARRVYSGNVKRGDGARILNNRDGFNINSARDLIGVFQQLMIGEMFQRGLSARDMDYFLSRIKSDFGPVALGTAIESLRLHIGYCEGNLNVRLLKLRGIAAAHQALVDIPERLDELEARFSNAVNRSFNDLSEIRNARLIAAPKIPLRTPILLLTFQRNPDVVAEVLHRAKGNCEHCKKAAPFFRLKDNSPYLEVNHLVHLADGGEDTVENAIAICPNCHRWLHYGAAVQR